MSSTTKRAAPRGALVPAFVEAIRASRIHITTLAKLSGFPDRENLSAYLNRHANKVPLTEATLHRLSIVAQSVGYTGPLVTARREEA